MYTVGIAKLVIAPGCGPGGRGFESHYSPHKKTVTFVAVFFYSFFPRGALFVRWGAPPLRPYRSSRAGAFFVRAGAPPLCPCRSCRAGRFSFDGTKGRAACPRHTRHPILPPPRATRATPPCRLPASSLLPPHRTSRRHAKNEPAADCNVFVNGLDKRCLLW